MGRYLIVANQTLAGGALLEQVRALHAADPSAFHVLVPATPPADHPWTEGEVFHVAQQRLDRCLQRFGDIGIVASGEVGDPHPVDAIRDVLLREEEPFDAIVLSTLRPGRSRWLKWDLLGRVQGLGVRVIHVIGEAEPVAHRARS